MVIIFLLLGVGFYLVLFVFINIYYELCLDVEFKLFVFDGVLLFSGGKSGFVEDFVFLVMVGGYLEFCYELGLGLVVLWSVELLVLGCWYCMFVECFNKDGSLCVNGGCFVLCFLFGKS